MDEIVYAGGRKYKAPSNMEQRLELVRIMRDLDTQGFRQFIRDHMPDLEKAGWLSFNHEDLKFKLHELRSMHVGLGDDFYESRNIVRARQFGYSEAQIPSLPRCAGCKWFREVPEGEDRSCMHLGSVPQDLACKGFTGLPQN